MEETKPLSVQQSSLTRSSHGGSSVIGGSKRGGRPDMLSPLPSLLHHVGFCPTGQDKSQGQTQSQCGRKLSVHKCWILGEVIVEIWAISIYNLPNYELILLYNDFP